MGSEEGPVGRSHGCRTMGVLESYTSTYNAKAVEASRRYFSYHLFFSGIYPSFKDIPAVLLEVTVRSIIYAMLVLGGLLLFYNLFYLRGTSLFFYHLHFLVLYSLIVMVCPIYRRERRHMTALLLILEKNIYRYKEELMEEMCREEDASTKRLSKQIEVFLTVVVFSAVSVFLTIVPIGHLLIEIPQEYKELAQKGVHIYLPLPSKMPFGSHIPGDYYWLLLLEYGSFFLLAFSMLSVAYFFMVNQLHVFRSLRIIKWGLDNMEERAHHLLNQKITNQSSATLDECYMACFKSTVSHYVELRRFYFELRKILHNPLIQAYYGSSLLFGICGYQVVTMSGSFVNWLANLLLGIAEIIHVGLFCFFAEHASSMHDDVQASINGLKWYTRSRQIKKDMLILLGVSMNDFSLKDSIGHELNRELFATLLNGGYSYINLLFAFKHK